MLRIVNEMFTSTIESSEYARIRGIIINNGDLMVIIPFFKPSFLKMNLARGFLSDLNELFDTTKYVE
ncbi:MAG: hypothetical protein PHR06_05680 [Candidatus Cloacimonetes bacterium]|nr:hypothetical protein [Candidatus Cloacimonadota bacterium]